LRVDVPQGLPPVLADADAPAARCQPDRQRATPRRAASSSALADGDAHVRFEVTDNGIGVRRERRRIFRWFYRDCGCRAMPRG
jgi:signal transduction histidine kinase